MSGRKMLNALFVILLLTGMAFAQEVRGRVQGVVFDPTGLIVPGANVVLHNDLTGVDTSRVTNSQGRYIFDYVDPGTYTLTVEVSSFKQPIQKNIAMRQRGDVTVDVTLEVGSPTDTITVTDSPIALQFNTTSHDLTLETKMVEDLPSATRRPLREPIPFRQPWSARAISRNRKTRTAPCGLSTIR